MTPWVRRLLVANILVFFLQYTNAFPAVENAMLFIPRLVLFRPWSPFTYMFLHAGIMHILWNMVGLYFFGPRVEARLGSTRFIQLYIVSGLGGAALSFITPNAAILGASGAIFGIMMAYAMFWPRDQVMIWGIIPIEIRWLVMGTTALAIFSGVGSLSGGMSGGNIAHFAHLGGYLGAWIFLKLVNPARTVAKFRAKTIAPMPDEKISNWKRVDVNKVHEVNREELNRILDKINTSGLSSLSAAERLFLSNFVPPDDRPKVS
jgi:membrane associated rhomboid family serine protease